jgi:NADH-quinone oxidoreductase subunit C
MPTNETYSAALGDAISNVEVFRDEITLTFSRERIIEALTHLRDEQKFDMFTDETCVDYLPSEPRYAIVYHLYSTSRNARVRLKVFLSEHDFVIPSACGVYQNANWYEREIYDLFGAQFTDHPDLRRILLPPDYKGHPMRRDIPVKVEEVAFSFNRQRIDKNKIYAKE